MFTIPNDYALLISPFIVCFLFGGLMTLGVMALFTLAVQLVVNEIFAICCLEFQQDLTIPIEIRALFPICYSVPSSFVIKFAAMIYQYFHYAFKKPTPTIQQKALRGELHPMKISWASDSDALESVHATRDAA
ncbi:hypothetical protein HK096_001921, partial [Nowakowskiella sp. JEL0078]